MPMKYFESRTYGEVLSRITNDVDTLGQGLNQSITTIITSVTTLIGVFIMMLTHLAAHDADRACDPAGLRGADFLRCEEVAEIL